MSGLLNQSGLAKALGVSVMTVSRLTAEGAIIPDIREGKVYRYDLAKVKDRLAERARAQSPEGS